MWTDEIVEEIRRIREEYAQSFNYELDAIFADLRKKEAASGREVVNLSRKPDLNRDRETDHESPLPHHSASGSAADG